SLSSVWYLLSPRFPPIPYATLSRSRGARAPRGKAGPQGGGRSIAFRKRFEEEWGDGGSQREPIRRRPLAGGPSGRPGRGRARQQDRKSTRLNSSHVKSSYAVMCLKT